ncbi:MAG: aminotransferase class I/II-fold pyridoxal phosphate-dependent enzyme, partial [Phycisphaerae bacterium]|nr:aminotransferase class I/II-fold pyridoxal phosphate-dependent enzyme [Phycisphaerae bacterium]
MSSWLKQLRADLDRRGREDMLRRLRATDACRRQVQREGRSLVNFAGNDYLALAGHPKLADAVAAAARAYGVGSGASRLVSGDLELHGRLEERLARFKHAEAALLFPTGYQANLGALTALAVEGDLICLDKLNHASLIDAARASGATVRVYPHGNLAKLQRLLEGGADARRRFIVTDAVFSMDGDCADLPGLCDLRDRFEAVLVVDEAHATG